MTPIDEHLDTLRAGAERLRTLEDEARLRRAHAQARAGDYARADTTLGSGWASARTDLRVGALLLRARMAAQQAGFDAAEAHLREILELDPDNADASAALAAVARGRQFPPGLRLATGAIAVAVLAGVVWGAVHLASSEPPARASAPTAPREGAPAAGPRPGSAPSRPADEHPPVSARLAAVRADLSAATRAFESASGKP